MRRAVFGARLSSARIALPVLLAGAELKHLPQEHEHGDHGGGFVVDRHDSAFPAQARGKEARRERRHEAVEIRRADPERDQAEHVE